MGGGEGTSNGYTEWLKREDVNNGFGVGMEHDFGDGSSVASEGFRTYKRRKHARSSSEGKGLEDGGASVEAASRLVVQGFDINKCSRTGTLYGSQYSAKGHVGVVSDGSLNASDHCNITNMCQRAFFDIIMSEKFSLLCKLLMENFNGMKVDGLFEFGVINSKLKGGTYETSPMRFADDIQQVWRKLQDIGAEMISLAKSLAEITSTSCNEHVGGLVHSTYDEEKNEAASGALEKVMQEKLFTRGPDSDAKLARPEACAANKVCTCRHCEEKADGKDCLVCDSCEEMYHVSCIEPAVNEIPPKSWYCASCTANGIGSPHENCVVCERLNAPRNQVIQVGDGISPPNETFIKFEGNLSCNTDEVQESEEKKPLHHPCGICGVRLATCDPVEYCGHSYCPYKYYHSRCLTPKQSKWYGSRWLCPSCLCRGCLTDKDDDKIVLCDSCDHAYHIYCMDPPRNSIPKSRWYCRKCEAGLKEIRRVKEVYENKQKKKGDRGMKAYENELKKKGDDGIKAYENEQKKKGDKGITAYENLEKETNGKSEEESDGCRGGMDMLLNAAKTLNFQENLAAKMKSLN